MADGRISIQVIVDDQDAINQLKDLEGDVAGIESAGDKSSITLGKLAGALGLVAAGAAAFNMIKTGIQTAFARIDTMEQFERTMTAMTGSTEEAGAALERTTGIVTGTGYGLDVAAKAVQGFVTSGVEINKATDYMAAFGDAVAFYGDGSNEQLASVSRAMAQLAASGTTNLEDINSLVDAGIPVFQLYGEAVGMSAGEARKALEGGKTDATEFLEVITDAMMNGTESFASIEGAAQDAGASWGAAFDNMQAAVGRGVTAIITEIDKLLTDNGLPTMRDMIAEVGSAFETALTWVANTLLPPVISGIGEVIEFIKEWSVVFEALGIVAAGVFAIIGAAATWTTIVKSIGLVTGAIKTLNLALLASPWTWLALAAVAAVVLIIKYWDEIAEYFAGQWEEIKEVAQVFWDWLSDIAKAVADGISEAWASFSEWFMGIWTAISEFFTGIWETMKLAAQAVWDFLQPYVENFVTNFKAIWEELSAFWSELWTALEELAMAIWTPIQEAIELFFSYFAEKQTEASEGWTATWEAIGTFFSTIWDGIKNVVQIAYDFIVNLFTPIGEFFSNIWNAISETATTIWNNLVEFFQTTWDNIYTTAQNIFNTVVEYFSNTWNNIFETAQEIWGTFSEWWNSFLDNFVEVAQAGWELFKETILGIINSLTALFQGDWEELQENLEGIWEAIKEFGETLWTEFKDFLEETWTLVQEITETVWNAIWEQLENIWNTIVEIGTTLWDSFKTYLQNLWDTMKSNFTTIWESIKETASDIVSDIYDNTIGKFGDMVEDVIGKMKDMYEGIKDWLGDTLKKVQETASDIFEAFSGVKLFDVGVDMINGLIKGIGSMVDTAVETAKGLIAKMPAAVKKVLGISSPSKLFENEIGKEMIAGLMVGMEVQTDAAVRDAEAIMREITNAFQGTPIEELIGQARHMATSAAQHVRSGIAQASGQNINNNAPGIEVVLEYYGDGSDMMNDARRMVNLVDTELSKRTDIAAWLKGFRAQRGSY